MIYKKKKAAIELSIGTIVIIVLAMSMLILGIVLVKNIFQVGNDIVDMTDSQLKNQINQLFGEDKPLVILPDSKEITIKNGEDSAFGVGMKNLLKGAESQEKKFSYRISVAEKGNCGSKSERDLENLIITGKELNPTTLTPGGDSVIRRVKLSIPEGFPLCSFSYKIESFYDTSTPYAQDFMDITIEA